MFCLVYSSKLVFEHSQIVIIGGLTFLLEMENSFSHSLQWLASLSFNQTWPPWNTVNLSFTPIFHDRHYKTTLHEIKISLVEGTLLRYKANTVLHFSEAHVLIFYQNNYLCDREGLVNTCSLLLLYLKSFVGFFDILNLHFGSDEKNNNNKNQSYECAHLYICDIKLVCHIFVESEYSSQQTNTRTQMHE